MTRMTGRSPQKGMRAARTTRERSSVKGKAHPPPSHQEALILHGGRYGLYDVYRIHNPEESLEAWRWEKVAFLGPEEVRERIVGDPRRGQGFDGLYRQVVKRTERGGISYHMARDPELGRLAGAMRALCEHDLAHLATLEAPCHRVHPQDETPGPPPEP
jgi:hypothetical protein